MTEQQAQRTDVTICGVPYTMEIADGGVLFSNKSGFWGVSGRFMFAYESNLWYLQAADTTFGNVAAVHLVRMHKLLCERVGADHEAFDMTIKPNDVGGGSP